MMAGNPNWWSVNGMHPQSSPPSSSSPWSQLLLGGLTGAGEDERFGTSLFQQQKKIENWEEQILNPSFRVPIVDVKQEVSQTSQLYGHGHHHIDDDHQYQAGSRSPCWPQLTNIPDSSPTSCITSVSNNNILNFSNSNLDREIKNQHQDHSLECNSTSIGGVAKKPKIQPSSTQPALKVRKEKLGDRITALHQLVSPFGKTDTASVLSEAIGYIRFLQGQIEALSSPYMSNASRNMGHQQSVQERDCSYPEESGQNNEDEAKDLRSRGLCLVPVSCTQHVGNDINGADYWAPALGGGF